MPITKASGQAVAPAAKGDLVVGSATNDAAVLSVGSANQVLTVDSSTTTGLKWATASSGGITLIQETVASANSSITFSSISGSYKQLYLVWQGIEASSPSSEFGFRINNDSSNIYRYSRFGIYNSGGLDSNLQSNTQLGDRIFGIYALGSGAAAADLPKGSILIDNYASTTRVKSFFANYSFFDNGQSFRRIYDVNGYYDSTTAITELNIYRISGSDTLTNRSNTSIRLYGIS